MELNRLPLVLWSGGLDSTFLLLNELKDNDVETLEISFGNTFQFHSEAEKRARDNLVSKFDELHREGRLKGQIKKRLVVNFEYPLYGDHCHISCYGQQPAWIFCAFMNHHPARHSCVMSGMVLSDSIVIAREGMVKAWEGLREITPEFSQNRYYGKAPITTLEFPLLHGCLNKNSVWAGHCLEGEIYDIWRWEIRDMAWYCYKPKQEELEADTSNAPAIYTPCGVCDSCVAHDIAVKTSALKEKLIEDIENDLR